MGDWVYNHRIGLMVTILLHLCLIIAFLSYQIILRPAIAQSVTIDMINEELLDQQQVIEEQKPEQQTIEDLDIRNVISNDNSKLDATLRDDRSSHTQELYDEAQRVQEALAQGGADYNDGMADIEASGRRAKEELDKLREQQSGSAGKDSRDERARYSGNVTVSYNLTNRTDRLLYIPAYRCEGGGQVTVDITVDQNGRVIAASVSKAVSTGDDCILSMAVQAARASTFNLDGTANPKQRGTITYLFIPQ